MRTRNAGIALAIGLLLQVRAAAAAGPADAACQLTPTVTASTSTILPGEPLDLTLHLSNKTGSSISLEQPSEKIGSVTLRIEDPAAPGTLRGYLGPGWGTEDSVQTPQPLAKGAMINLPLRVLYQVVRQQPYALLPGGTYRLTVRYRDATVCPQGTAAPVVTVQVSDPKGPDLSVWNAIKDCGRCGHFLHTGKAGKGQQDQDAVALLRSLVRQYPSSRYAKLIRRQLAALSGKAESEDSGDKGKDE